MGLAEELRAYGALPSQLVDVSRADQSRVLSYLDMRIDSPGWQHPVVVENARRPCVHVFDGRRGVQDDEVARWCWRIALRGDGAWVGVLEPGRLRVFRADVKDNTVHPTEVETAKPGEWALPKFLNDVSAGQDDVARRKYLTKLLDGSARDATALGLSQKDALSLVGRGLFWRFLVDRKVLAGLEPREVCDTAQTWEQCLDGKARALKTFHWLDKTFNGGLLPFGGKLKDFKPDLFSSVLGNIAHGATETGQLRLPTDWQDVNFSHVPVGLLSEVYEAFAHHIDASDATRKSIHYTPSHIVDFVVAQALEQLPSEARPRVLDPAAGAGAFLVTVLRQLVEREWRQKSDWPKRQRIRAILNEQLVGFDVDSHALRLAELALYLTALEIDPDPKPKPLDDLKFDQLRDNVLFDLSKVEQGSLGPIDARFREKFDLVIGNPPWTAKADGGDDKKTWIKHSRQIVCERLGPERAAGFDLPDTNTDLPFIWRAMEWAKKGGRLAFMTHARWLFGISDRAMQARNDLLQATRITGILNGSALRLTNVWPTVDAPWCVLFATNELPHPTGSAAFQFVSPVLDAEVDSKQTRLRIDWTDAQTVRNSDVIEHPWTLKVRFRGNRLAARTLESMQEKGESLGEYLSRLGTKFWNGYQVSKKKQGRAPSALHLKGMPDTKDAGPLSPVLDAALLPKFNRATTYRRKERDIFRAPLLLLRKAIPADLASPRAHIASEDVAFHESLHGASFATVPEGEDIVAYLQLVLQSATFPFFEILTDAQYGMFVDAIYLESALRFPVIPFDQLSRPQRARVRQLSRRLAKGLTRKIVSEIDKFIFDTFDLSSVDREAIRDTLDTALPSTESKRKAVAVPTEDERKCFVAALTQSLQAVLSASELHAAVEEQPDLRWRPWRVIKVCVSRETAAEDVEAPIDSFLEEADVNGASLVVVRASTETWFLGLLERYALWTPTRARLLATDLIAERSST